MISRANALIGETSPYLLMHSKNPVYWYPWSNEALDKAKKENKLLVISIGYAACHWCHVMEQESFSNNEVATLMNSSFVSIKIDREERPDLDNVFMDVAHLTTGKGGWPLNIIALPNGRPVFAGTYFQKRQWMNLLNEIQHIFEQEPHKLEDLALQIKAGIERMDFVGLVKDSALFTNEMMNKTVESWKGNFDYEWGGNLGAPKFPMPVEFNFLLSYLYKNDNSGIREYINISLKRMARGGIYDHLGGGFSRYSVDRYWKVPHFEKMLYDQGQLIEIYSKAYKMSKDPLYKSVVEETIAFVNRELKSVNGGYFSSLDADSEGEEGKFYVWRKDELFDLLGADAQVFCDFYNINEAGNWEFGKNVLFQTESIAAFATEIGFNETKLQEIITRCKTILLKVRSNRERPLLDNKILTSWNAIMIKGLVQAYMALGDENYLNDAIAASEYIKGKALRKGGGLWRSLKGEKGVINGFLDDYALLIDAWIDLYQATFDQQWIDLANGLCEYVSAYFFNDDNQLFYYTSAEDDPLLVRKTEISDNVIPASNSVMAFNLYRLSKYYLNKEAYHTAFQMLKNLSGRIDEHGKYYANWQRLKLFFIYQNFELVIAGKDDQSAQKNFLANFHPFVFLASGSDSLPISENKDSEDFLLHLCQNNTCHLPMNSLEEVFEKLYHSNGY